MTAMDVLMSSRDMIAAVCQRHRVLRLAVFGSALRDELNDDSDIDFLVEFTRDHVPGLLTIAGIELELKSVVGREVELRTYADLSTRFRDHVRRDAQEIYAAA